MTPNDWYEKFRLSEAETKLGYRFSDRTLLLQALTHQTFSEIHPECCPESNERLEFLGDAVLQWVISAKLFREFPQKREGELTKIRSGLVSRKTLTRMAVNLGLDEFLLVENRTGISEVGMQNLLSNAMEAIIGAIYLDLETTGDLARVFVVVEQICDRFLAGEVPRPASDPKSSVNEWLQKNAIQNACYRISEVWIDEEKKYRADFMIGEKTYGHGIASSKKEAEKLAAEQSLPLPENFKNDSNQ